MIQQKKINSSYCSNNDIFKNQYYSGKSIVPNRQSIKNGTRKHSISQLKKSQINQQNQNSQNKPNKNQKDKTIIKTDTKTLNVIKNTHKQKIQNEEQKFRRKTNKQTNLNISNSAIVLSQINQKNKYQSHKPRKSLLVRNESQIKNMKKIDRKKSNLTQHNYELQRQIVTSKQKQQEIKRRNKSNIQILTNKKPSKSQKRLLNQQRKHLSCASIIEGRIKSKSKSKSKDKEKKNKKRKKSYKFKQINIANKQNQNYFNNKKDSKHVVVQSIEKQFKSITKKINLQLQKQRKKSSMKFHKQGLEHNEGIIQTKKISLNTNKISNKQNKDPKRNLSQSFNDQTFIPQLKEVHINIKKEPLHINKKQKEKNQRKLSKRSNQKTQKDELFFLVRKQSSPQSSRKEFPVNKYFTKKQDTFQSKRTSFQKTVKTNKKRKYHSQEQTQMIHSHRESLNKKQQPKYFKKQKSQQCDKTKEKNQMKRKGQTYSSCLYLWADQFEKQERKKNQSLSDHDLIYKSQSQQMKEQLMNMKKTPKQNNRSVCPDDQETIMRRKKTNSIVTNSPSKKYNFNQSELISQQKFRQSIQQAQSFNKSLNIQQIRYFQQLAASKQSENSFENRQPTFVSNQMTTQNNYYEPKIFQKKYKIRQGIMNELRQEYQLLTKKQLQFLASICFIQRKWKQSLLAKQIKSLISAKQSQNIFKKKKTSKGDLKELMYKKGENQIKNVSNISTHLAPFEAFNKSQLRNLTTQSQNTQTQQYLSFENIQNKHDYIDISKNAMKKHDFKQSQQKSVLIKDSNSLQIKQKSKQINLSTQNNVFMLKQQLNQQKAYPSPITHKQQDIFPDIEYLKTKKSMLKQKFIQQISNLTQQLKYNKISNQVYFRQKQQLQTKYKTQLKQLHETKKTLKKGYLKYIKTLNQVNSQINQQDKKSKKSIKNSSNHSSHKLLKKVNSEENIIGLIYKKIFKIEQLSSDNGSQSSGQTRRLNEMLLIRKINDENGGYHNTHYFNNRVFNGIGKNLGTFQYELGSNNTFSGRKYYKQAKDNEIMNEVNQNILSMRETKSMQIYDNSFSGNQKNKLIKTTEIQFRKGQNIKQKEEEIIVQQNIKLINQALNVNKIESTSFNISQLIKNRVNQLQLQSKTIKQTKKPETQHFPTQKQHATSSKPPSILPSFKIQTIQDQIQNICFSLQHPQEDNISKEFFQEQNQHPIDENQQKVQHKLSSQKYLQYNYTQKQLDQYEKQLTENFKQLSETYKEYGKEEFFDQHQNQQNEQEHGQSQFNQHMPDHFSPITSVSMLPLCNIQSKEYLENFLRFISASQYWSKIVNQNLNKSQGFKPFSYLKFIRQYQIPQQCYFSIIPIQAFQQWEEIFCSKYDFNGRNDRTQKLKAHSFDKQSFQQGEGGFINSESWRDYSMIEFRKIQHRCLYEFLNTQLQQYRVYGFRGKPFPWEVKYSHYEPHKIDEKDFQTITQKCMKKMQFFTLNFSCGIILQNHPQILSQEQLQDLHDKNEDNIIDMLQSQLMQQKQNWYEMDEHILQLRLQLSQKLFYDLIEQFNRQINYLKR